MYAFTFLLMNSVSHTKGVAMNICKINGKYYIVDFDNLEFYSISNAKTFTFKGELRISEIKDYLNKYDA